MIYNNVGWSEMDFNFNFNNLILISSKNLPFFSPNNFIYCVDLSWLSIYEEDDNKVAKF